MNSSRLFRALITGVTLVICIWVLTVMRHHTKTVSSPAEPVEEAAPPDTTKSAQSFVIPQRRDSCPPVEIQNLPLAALDNTCFDGIPTDLSCYTGMLSGGEAREYLIHLEKKSALRIAVEPRTEHFDASFALFGKGKSYLLGRDEKPAGMKESGISDVLEPGVYRLFVGGYSEDCGPYVLTVRDQAPPVVRVSDLSADKGRNGTVIRWKSFAEVDLAHFSLYRVDPTGRQRIAVMRAHGSPAGFSDYRFIDRSLASDGSYEIEAVSRDGRTELLPIASS